MARLANDSVTRREKTIGSMHGMKVLKKWLRRSGLAAFCALTFGVPALADYSQHPQAKAFVDDMVAQHGFKREEVLQLLARAERQQTILDAISRPAEQVKPWKDYRKLFITNASIAQGANFWREHADTLARAEREFGVSPAIIVAILGVETRYGRNAGNYRVLDALATLGFDYPPRSPFFRNELAEFMLMTREQKLGADKVLGSYAGAMGYGQFMPSSYRKFAVDFNGDGVVDIVNNVDDAIGSVANYFKSFGWQHNAPIAVRANVTGPLPEGLLKDNLLPVTTLAEYRRKGVTTSAALPDSTNAALFVLEGDNGPEYWLGLNNFYVITRYNRSQMYSMAVVQLSEAVSAQWQQQR